METSNLYFKINYIKKNTQSTANIGSQNLDEEFSSEHQRHLQQ